MVPSTSNFFQIYLEIVCTWACLQVGQRGSWMVIEAFKHLPDETEGYNDKPPGIQDTVWNYQELGTIREWRMNKLPTMISFVWLNFVRKSKWKPPADFHPTQLHDLDLTQFLLNISKVLVFSSPNGKQLLRTALKVFERQYLRSLWITPSSSASCNIIQELAWTPDNKIFVFYC